MRNVRFCRFRAIWRLIHFALPASSKAAGSEADQADAIVEAMGQSVDQLVTVERFDAGLAVLEARIDAVRTEMRAEFVFPGAEPDPARLSPISGAVLPDRLSHVLRTQWMALVHLAPARSARCRDARTVNAWHS